MCTTSAYLECLVKREERRLKGGELDEVGKENSELLLTGLDLPPTLRQAQVVPVRLGLDLGLDLVLLEDGHLDTCHVVCVGVHTDVGSKSALQHRLPEVAGGILGLGEREEGARGLSSIRNTTEPSVVYQPWS